jgi:cell division protein FtsN
MRVAYDFGDSGGGARRATMSLTMLRAGVVVASLAVFTSVVWYSYDEGTGAIARKPVPFIKASLDPIKVRPKSPGGLQVPDRDKKVYERMEGDQTKKKAEAPKEKEKIVGELTSPPPPRPRPREPVTEQARLISGGRAHAIASVEWALLRKRKIMIRQEKAAAKVRKASKASSADRAYRVQIAAYETPEDAARLWHKLVGRHEDLFGELDWYVEKLYRGKNKAPLYRLQVGPFKDRKAAQDMCTKLGERKISCLLVTG